MDGQLACGVRDVRKLRRVDGLVNWKRLHPLFVTFDPPSQERYVGLGDVFDLSKYLYSNDLQWLLECPHCGKHSIVGNAFSEGYKAVFEHILAKSPVRLDCNHSVAFVRVLL